jgi:hypothetical protein
VLFVVHNSGGSGTSCSITDVYWGYEGPPPELFQSTVGIHSATTSSGVSFSNGASPGSPPGSYTWEVDASADSNAPTSPNGVRLNETAGFLLTLKSGRDWDDVLGAFTGGTLHMALKVQSIGSSGQSDWFNSNPGVSAVPEPATFGLMAGAMGVAALLRRRRKRSQPA